MSRLLTCFENLSRGAGKYGYFDESSFRKGIYMPRPIACGRRIRVSVWVFILFGSWMCGAFGFWAMTERVNFPTAHASTLRYQPLSIDDRVRYQRKLEAVYWKHRLWPAENPKPKPSFDQVTTEADLRHQVETTVRQSLAWQVVRHQPVSGEELQAELDRIARQSRDTELLQELFDALDNDPAVIAECLVRPLLVQRELGQIFEHQVPAESEIPDQSTAAELTFDAWWTALASSRDIQELASPHFAYRMPDLSAARRFDPSATDCDQWSPISNDRGPFWTPYGGGVETAVWTGSEMIVWGGYTNQGARYNPAIDTWFATSRIGAPVKREGHTAIWTGKEMIVWGGVKRRFGSDGRRLDSGGRYDPYTDTWKPVTMTGAPSRRRAHSAIWTGKEMIVWGGVGPDAYPSNTVNDGARYSPETDTWKPVSLAQAPTVRTEHRAVWTGKEMIVWGGLNYNENSYQSLNTGGRYFPETDTWQETSLINAPLARSLYMTVWTGQEMIVWGGRGEQYYVGNTGARYNPETDSWATMSPQSSSSSARSYDRASFTAVWTGEEMIVWSGSGARYYPKTDTWTPIRDYQYDPEIRFDHVAVWTGREMIVWGGSEPRPSQMSVGLNSGARYDPKADQWTEMSIYNRNPSAQAVVWTGVEMIVFGQNASGSGSRYFPVTDSWINIRPRNSPYNLYGVISVWTGTEALLISGIDLSYPDFELSRELILRYNPTQDQWLPPEWYPYAGGSETSAVWTGTEALIWGGVDVDDEYYRERNIGCRFNPATNEFSQITQAGAPDSRVRHKAVWTGKEMIIWGGNHAYSQRRNTGAIYSPATNTWRQMRNTNAPRADGYYSVVWTGTEMIVWGAYYQNNLLQSEGKRYNPVSNEWQDVSLIDVPEARLGHTAVWTGSRMIIWGGGKHYYNPPYVSGGGEYNPVRDVWKPLPTENEPPGRSNHSAIWTGKEMIIWGKHKKGGQYRPCGSTQ